MHSYAYGMTGTSPDGRILEVSGISGTGRDLRPGLPLVGVFGDERLAILLHRESYVHAWVRVEQALVEAEADVGLIGVDEAGLVVRELSAATIDLDALDAETLVVGYPILPLLEQLGAASEIVGRYVHWGATTQDIMDTGLVLVVRDAMARIRELVLDAGDGIQRLMLDQRTTLIAARTHARPAVPTTVGAKLAVWLGEFTRHLDRCDEVEARLYNVSLHGAGGTAAAFGPHSVAIREAVAARLGLAVTDVPWHASRDVIAELGFVLAAMAATAGRIGREIVDLSRPEIGELSEADGHRRGASSTMPQKANPIASETAVGFSVLAMSGAAALLTATQVEHERSAGEWQIEWDALPSLVAATGGALLHIGSAISGLVVHRERMRANVEADGGSIMAEAAMMALAVHLGRERAHDLVYDAVRRARGDGVSLERGIKRTLEEADIAAPIDLGPALDPDRYVGEAPRQVEAASAAWARHASHSVARL